MPDSTPLDWAAFTPPASWKKAGDEWAGPCPVTGAGKTKAWANPSKNTIGCRECGDGAGKVDGAAFRDHAAALGLLVDLGAAPGGKHREIERWTWETADRKRRDQIRRAGCGLPDCERCQGARAWKHWAPTVPRNNPPPRALLYVPGGVPAGPAAVYVCEGASDADAVRRLGLHAIGRTNARPSAESLARFDTATPLRVWPDVDDDGAGYRQAVTWADAAIAAGLNVAIVDPLVLRSDAPSGFDARDWCESLPDETDAAGAAALLDAAVTAVDAIRNRAAPPAAASAAPQWTPPPDALPIPRVFVALCDSEEAVAIMVAERSAGRLRHDADAGLWLCFTPSGWTPALASAVEECLADCARLNIGSRDKDGEVRMRPASGGRRSVGRAVAGLLAGRPEIVTRAAEWDAEPDVILLPGGDALNARTGARTPPAVTDLYRRRVGVEPADRAALARSLFRRVVEHAIPDPAERRYLQRRLGAALVDAEGLDDLPWLFGPPGCGKGTVIQALRQTFGDLAGGVPTGELLRGGTKGHTAWLARLQGCRLLIADDVPVGRYVDDATVNQLLGSVITAQHMRCRPFDFRLQAPLICTSNAPPQITSTNVRRLRPIQCGGHVANPDPGIRAAMSTDAEIAACLRWLLDGVTAFAEHGCPVPDSCRERAAEAAASSPVAEFTATFAPGERCPTGAVFDRWRTFKTNHGERSGSHRAMVGELRAAGWRDAKSNGVRYLVAPAGSLRVASEIESYTRVQRLPKTHIQSNSEATLSDPAPVSTGANAPPAPTVETAPDFPAGALGAADEPPPEPPPAAPPPADPPSENGAPGGQAKGADLSADPPPPADPPPADDGPPDPAAWLARQSPAIQDAFARGADVRRRAERDGPLPERIRVKLLSSDPAERTAGHRLAILDYADGGEGGRRLLREGGLAARLRFMQSPPVAIRSTDGGDSPPPPGADGEPVTDPLT